jgi:leader peptidase (prepilin peptidase) / N-methyltransferase
VMPRAIGTRWLSVVESAIGAGVASGVFWLFGWAFEKIRHRQGLGLGDIKMIAMIGAFLGLRLTMFSLFAASLIGSVVGVIYIFATRKKASEYHLPFGSFIGAATLAVAMLSDVVSVWLPKR